MLPRNIRYAFRSLVRTPGVTIVAVVCLALGIGVNSTIFAVVDGVLLQPFPYVDPENIVILNVTHQRSGIREAGLSYLDLKDWREQNRVFTTVAAIEYRSLTVSADRGEPERYLGGAITWDLFDMLGERPALGRWFTPEDDRPGAEPVVILSDEIWLRRYMGDPSIVGQRVYVNAKPYTVVGVAKPNFKFPESQLLWVPLAPFVHEDKRDARGLMALARLKPGVTLEQARSDMDAIARRLQASYPDTNEGWGALVRPLRDEFIPDDVSLVIWTMMGAVTLVLLIACANVANLLLARASSRHREISIRAALGAGRAHIVSQLLVESLMLALLATPFGIVLAYLGIWLLDNAIPAGQIPYYIHWAIDARTLVYTIVVAALTGIAFGLFPAIQAGRTNLVDSLKEGGRGSATGGKRARLRNGLVAAEVALSLVLLVGASLFVRSYFNLQTSNGGFDTRPLMTLRFYLTGDTYETSDARAQRVEDIVRRVEELPGVDAAVASNLIPLSGGGSAGRAIVEGHTVAKENEPLVAFVSVTPHLLKTLNVPLVKGRTFTDAEGRSRTAVAVINQTMAEKLWPKEDPIGRRFKLRGDQDAPDWFTIIGVATDFRHEDVDDDDAPLPAAYVPYPYGAFANTGLIVRVSGDPTRITAPAREAIRASDPHVPLFQIRSMEEVKSLSFWEDQLFGWMFSIFGGLALFLAAIGVYGVLSYAVSQRAQEIGVRVALGADRHDVLRLIVGHGLRLASIGIACGLAGAFLVTRVIRTLLYNVTPTDPVSFVSVSLFLTLIALLASYIPARRAMAVDPIVALRNQ